MNEGKLAGCNVCLCTEAVPKSEDSFYMSNYNKTICFYIVFLTNSLVFNMSQSLKTRPTVF